LGPYYPPGVSPDADAASCYGCASVRSRLSKAD